MLITCRIWFWQFIEVWVWFTGGHKLSALKQERHRIRLRKEKEKEMVAQQKEDGHWAFELEADATIPSEYIFLNLIAPRNL